MRRLAALVALIALVAAVALSACSEKTGTDAAAVPHPSGSGVSCLPPPSGEPSPARDTPLSGVTLPCFAGGAGVRLAALGRPAVVNLWASWCEPCHVELPALNTYAARAGVLVVGVATKERGRSATASTISELGLTFPTLYDDDGTLLLAAGRITLPVTLFVTADGRVAYTYNSTPLDAAAFERLAREHLGVS